MRTSSSTPPVPCPGTCRRCGRPAPPSSTTWSTATPAWATSCPPPWAPRWPGPRAKWSIIGDGTFQMAPQEIATIVSERVKVILVILNNHGWSSIGSLSESHGSQRFGTRYRMRNEDTGLLDGELVPLDIPANIRSYGIEVQEVSDTESFRAAYRRAESSAEATAIVVNTNLYGPNPPGNGWWDVPVSQVSRLESTQTARDDYEHQQSPQRHYL